jgi:hypothetical protein
MSKFDFNNPFDFAKATLSTGAGQLADFSDVLEGRDPALWDIQEGSYNGVLFHVFTSKSSYQAGLSASVDTGGRRKVYYMFPYQDGQTSDDLGRKPETFQMDILIHGQRYLTGLRNLITQFQKPQPGVLIHPVMGELRCVVQDYTLTHNHEHRKAAELRVTFAEHNFEISRLTQTKDNTLFGALSAAIAGINAIEQTVTRIQTFVGIATSVRNRALTRLSTLKAGYATLLTNINTSFNGDAAGIPSLLPVNQGGNRGSDGELVTDIFRTAANTISETTAQALAIEQLIKDTNTIRADIAGSIVELKSIDALEFYAEILDLRKSAVLIQQALEAAVSSSQPRVINYTTPRLMSIREVAFANGVALSRIQDLDLLNPSLESTNFIPKGVMLKVSLT